MGLHIEMKRPTDGTKSDANWRQAWTPKRICSMLVIPSAMKPFVIERLYAFRSLSSGHA
ncbi:hypothetical protein D3C84_1158520 [compost metagenome]